MVNSLGRSGSPYASFSSNDYSEPEGDEKTGEMSDHVPMQEILTESTDSPITRILKNATKYVSDTLRPGDENYLFDLTGDNQIRNAIKQFMPELCDAIEILFPVYLKKVGGKDKPTITHIAENLVLHVLANFGKEFFGEIPDHKITKETFFGKLGYYLIKLIWSHISEIDESIKDGAQLENDAFKPLAKELLKIALPKDQEGLFSQLFAFGEKKIASGYLLEPLSSFLLFAYKKFIIRESSTTTSTLDNALPNDKQEDLKDLIELAKKGIGFLIQSFANHIIHKEDKFFQRIANNGDISKIIKSLLSPLISHLVNVLPKQYQELLFQNSSALADLVTSLMMIILGSIGREYKNSETETIELSELFEYITLTIFNNTHLAFKKVLAFVKKKQRVRAKYYQKFVRKIISTLMPQHVDFFKLISRRFPEIELMICEIALDFVSSMDINNLDVHKQELRTLLWNKDEILKQHPTLNKLTDIPNEALSIAFGNEELVDLIYQFCSKLGEKSLKYIRDFIDDENALNDILLEGVPELEEFEAMPKIIRGVSDALLSKEKSTNAFLFYIQDWVGSIIFKGCVIFLKNSSSKKLDTNHLIPLAIRKLINVCGGHLATIRHNIANVSDEDEQLQHCFFKPLANDLTKLFFSDSNPKHKFKYILPLPVWLRGAAAKLLTTHAFPMLLNKCYNEITVWERKKGESRKILSALFGNKRASEVCRVLSQFVPEFLSYFFRTSSHELASLLVDQAKGYLNKPTPKEMKRIKRLIAFAIKFIGSKNQHFTKLWFFISSFSESALLKVFADFFEKINAMEQLYLSDPSKCFEGGLNFRFGLGFIDEVTKHFQLVNQIKNSIGEKRASRVPTKVMLDGFKSAKAIIKTVDPLDPEFKDFFSEYSSKILRFVGLDKNAEIPLPKIGKKAVWNLFEGELFPKLLGELFNKLTSLPTIHRIILSSLRNVNEAINNLEIHSAKKGKNKKKLVFNKVPDDHLQRELVQMCAAVVGSVVDLQPSAIAQKFLEYRNIRLKVGEAIAHSVRENTERFSTLELCDQIFENTLTSIHPGKWVSRKNQAVSSTKAETKDRFIPHKTGSNGKITKGFSFPFPKTKAETKDFALKNKKEDQNVASEVVKELSGMISKQTKLTLNAGLLGMWEKFQGHLEAVIEKNFHEYGLNVKHQLDAIFHAIFSVFIQPIIKITFFPIVKLIWVFLDIYLKNQSKWRAGDLGIDINKFLFFKIFDSSFNLLEQRNRALKKRNS